MLYNMQAYIGEHGAEGPAQPLCKLNTVMCTAAGCQVSDMPAVHISYMSCAFCGVTW